MIETIYDGIRWKLDLEHSSWSFYADLVEGYSPKVPELELQHGVVSPRAGGENQTFSEWYSVVILHAKEKLTPHGVAVEIVGSDKSLQMKGRTRTQAWKMTFDTLVRTIAAEYGLAANVEPADETNKGAPITYWQYGENDWEFIRRQAAKQKSAGFTSGPPGTGRADYDVWVELGRTLHARPPGTDGPAKRSWGTGELGRGLKSIKFFQRKQALQLEGGFGVQGYGFDMLTKTPTFYLKNYANFPENMRLGPRYNPPLRSEIPARTFRSTAANQLDLQKTADAVMGSVYRNMYLAEIEIVPDFSNYNVGDVVTIAVDQNGKPDPIFSGNYLVVGRKTTITGRDIRMKLLGSRVGSQSGTLPVPGRQMDAPAIDLQVGRKRLITAIRG